MDDAFLPVNGVPWGRKQRHLTHERLRRRLNYHLHKLRNSFKNQRPSKKPGAHLCSIISFIGISKTKNTHEKNLSTLRPQTPPGNKPRCDPSLCTRHAPTWPTAWSAFGGQNGPKTTHARRRILVCMHDLRSVEDRFELLEAEALHVGDGLRWRGQVIVGGAGTSTP